jgi:hypothetical protein
LLCYSTPSAETNSLYIDLAVRPAFHYHPFPHSHMDLQRREEFKQRLYDLTPSDGKAMTNVALRKALEKEFPTETFSLDDYWDLRNSLITEAKLEKGRGRGGTVWRVVPIEAPSDATATATPSEVTPGLVQVQRAVTEASLYEPFQRYVQESYAPDNDLRPWICEITAAQGRRNTGGLWTRPDVTLIAIQTFAYFPGKQFHVVTFEVKADIEGAMEGVYECAAHSAFAHLSYLAFPAVGADLKLV